MIDQSENASIQKLLKATNNVESSSKSGIEITKKKMQKIWSLLSADSNFFEGKEVANILMEIKSNDFRLLYSQLSANFFNLDERERANVLTNTEKLINYAYENSEENSELKKMSIKIYDHCQLVSQQIESIQKLSAISVEKAKNKLEEETKGMEKEYISILGIFASVVLAFMGGISFSSSVLSAINKAPILRLVFVINLLGFVLANVIYLLLNFIAKINSKHNEKAPTNTKFIVFMNLVFLVILIGVIIIHVKTGLDM